MMEKLFICLILSLSIQTVLACTPGVAGTGPSGDPHCLLPMIHNDPYYNGSNIVPPRKTKPKVIYLKKPDSWGAIAETKMQYGVVSNVFSSTGHSTKNEAKVAAINECERQSSRSCEYVLAFANACGALAEGQDQKQLFRAFTAIEKTAEKTEEAALRKCKKSNYTDCKIIVPAQCSLPK